MMSFSISSGNLKHNVSGKAHYELVDSRTGVVSHSQSLDYSSGHLRVWFVIECWPLTND